MPPPARPPWQPEQLKRMNSWRPSPAAVRSPAYGFGTPLPDDAPPGMGPTAAIIGGGAAVMAPFGGVRPQAAAAASTTDASAIALQAEDIHRASRGRVLLDLLHRPDDAERRVRIVV